MGACPVAVMQQRYTYQVLSVLAAMLTKLFVDCPSVIVYVDLHNHRVCEALHPTILPSLLC